MECRGRVSRQTPQGRHRGRPESMHSLLHNAVPFQGGARQAEGWGESLPAPRQTAGPSECRLTPADSRTGGAELGPLRGRCAPMTLTSGQTRVGLNPQCPGF